MVAEVDSGVDAANALVSVIPGSRWEAVAIAHAVVAISRAAASMKLHCSYAIGKSLR